jgi:hypothetical protein
MPGPSGPRSRIGQHLAQILCPRLYLYRQPSNHRSNTLLAWIDGMSLARAGPLGGPSARQRGIADTAQARAAVGLRGDRAQWNSSRRLCTGHDDVRIPAMVDPSDGHAKGVPISIFRCRSPFGAGFIAAILSWLLDHAPQVVAIVA